MDRRLFIAGGITAGFFSLVGLREGCKNQHESTAKETAEALEPLNALLGSLGYQTEEGDENGTKTKLVENILRRAVVLSGRNTDEVNAVSHTIVMTYESGNESEIPVTVKYREVNMNEQLPKLNYDGLAEGDKTYLRLAEITIGSPGKPWYFKGTVAVASLQNANSDRKLEVLGYRTDNPNGVIDLESLKAALMKVDYNGID